MAEFLDAYLKAQQGNQQADAATLQQATGLVGIMDHLKKQRQEQQYRADLAALGPNPDQDALAAVSAKYASPADVLKTQQASLDRKATLEAAKANKDAALAQGRELKEATLTQGATQFQQMMDFRMSDLDRRREEFGQRITDQKARDEFNQSIQQEKLRLQEQQNQFSNALRQQGYELQRQGQQIQLARVDQGNQNRQQSQQQQFGTALERAGLPEGDATLRGAEEALKNQPEVAKYFTGINSLKPNIIVPEEIAKAKQAITKLFNITLKNRSGAAVTVPEFERLKQEFGSGLWSRPEQLAEGLRQAREIISQHYRGIASGFHPDVVNSYNTNLRESGGTPLLDSGGNVPAPTWDSAKEQRYQELLRKKNGAK